MSSIITDNTHYCNIANAIREKNGTETTYKPSEMAQAIASIEAGSGTNEDLIKMLTDAEMEEFVFPEGITNLRQGAFYSFTNLKSVYVPDIITDIGMYAFKNCTGLQNARLPAIETLRSEIFYGCFALTDVSLEDTTKYLSSGLFQNCTSLENIKLPSELRSLGTNLFSGCSKLKTINIPSKVNTLGSNVFAGCTSLEFVTIEQGFNRTNLNLSASTLYSVETIVNWFNALADRSSTTAATLTIGATNIAKLTEE